MEISADADVDEVSVVVEADVGDEAFAVVEVEIGAFAETAETFGVEVEVAVMIIITHPIQCSTREDVAEVADMAMGLQWGISKHPHT